MAPEPGEEYKPLEDEETTEKMKEKKHSDMLTVEDMVNK